MLPDASPFAPALALLFLLGLRHGLDPDHVAVIDNLTFRASEERPRLAPWVGGLFALGHSASVAVVAIGASLLAARVEWPVWISEIMEWASIGLLLLVGTLNLRALLAGPAYVPAGWRQGLVPAALRNTCHPAAIVAVGAIFGLVFDTATQAATWGLAAASTGGVAGAALIAATFAAGMIATDMADSWIVAGLLRRRGDQADVARYRRSVGWLIVTLSFGMAAYALAGKTPLAPTLPEIAATALGLTMAAAVVATLAFARRRRL